MGAPSNPALIFPPCPACGAAVTATDLDEAGWYELADPDLPNTYTAPINKSSAPSTRIARPTLVDGVHSAPEYDVLTLAPCGCELQGTDGHQFSVAALNLTWPHLTIEVTVRLPAGLLCDAPYPTTREITSTYTRDDLTRLGANQQRDAGGDPAAGAPEVLVPKLVRAAAEMLARSIEQPPDPAETGAAGDQLAAAGRVT